MATPATDESAIRQAIRALRSSGYTLVEVWDGEEAVRVRTKGDALAAIMAVDDATLWVRTPEGDYNHWVRFVMGNEPYEVICDHHVGLSPVLDPLTRGWWPHG